MDDIVLVEGMPVDSVFAFVWNLMSKITSSTRFFFLMVILHLNSLC